MRSLLLGAVVPLVLTASAVSPSSAVAVDPGIVPGLPEGVPAAATAPEPHLRTPRGWPFEQRISRTSGTGRLHDGASYWTDFVDDDHGAAIPSGFTLDNTALLAPYQGVYTYDDPQAHGNGADIFVAAAGVDAHASYWRVDFATLTDPDVPLAVWAFDTDRDATTGTDEWPAAAGITSPGLDRALVVSSRGAWLQDLHSGRSVDVSRARGGRLTIDRRSGSFVVRVPERLLPVSGRWRVRLATGVAAPDGRSLATPSISGVPATGLARAYNLAFRRVRQEPPIYTDGQTSALVAAFQALAAGTPPFDQLGADGQARFVTGNFWNEDHQADVLATGDVSLFSRTLDWAALRHRRSTEEPLVHGSSTRWYQTSRRLHLGAGIVANRGGPTSATGDGRPNFLGRIQPYAVYVPYSYRPGRATPLTWTLHSLSVNHNQYAAYDPLLLRRLCEQRDSICAGTLGRGPDGWYFDEAEADYWAVWGALARSFTLDPTRTVLTGYSMGGWAAYHLGLAHPDLYAEAVALAGPPQCGVSLDGDQLVNPAFGGRCTTDGTAYDLVGNARWLPYRIGQGQLDELVPFTSVERQVARFSDLGLRHRFVRYPGEDHLIFATQDRFTTVLSGLGRPQVVRNPRSIDYTWRPHLTRRGLGIGATTAYWTSRLSARDNRPGSLARVRATSYALAGRHERVVRSGPTPVLSPLPAVRQDLRWQAVAPLPRSPRLTLRLENVSRLAVDLGRAGMQCGTVTVRTDGPVRLLLEPARGDVVRRDLSAGSHRLRLRC